MNHIKRVLVPTAVKEGPQPWPHFYTNRIANVHVADLDAFVEWFGAWSDADADPDPLPYITEIDTWYYGPRIGLILCLSGDAATDADMETVLNAWHIERARARAAEELSIANAMAKRLQDSNADRRLMLATNQLALL